MPLYEFECKSCKCKTTSIEKLNIKQIKCKCGNYAHKILSVSNFVINGFSEKNGYSNDK